MTLTPVQIPEFELFAIDYLPHFMKVKSPPEHHDWYRALSDRREQYLCFEAGRGSAKSTIASVAFSLFNICTSLDESMQIASRSTGKTGTATKIMKKVKRELETNQPLISHYGIQRGADWGQEAIEVVRGDGHRIEFYSVGKHSSIRGSRGTVLVDDPQNSADVRSETVLAADLDWFLEDVVPVIIGDQRLIFIGTPIGPLALLEKVKRLPGFKVHTFPMERPPWSGRSAWPEQYSDEFLAQRMAVLGKDRYGAEYLCKPKVSGNPVFRDEWFQHYEPDSQHFIKNVKREIVYVITGGDAAESKQDQADWTAFVTIGQTYGKKPDYYVLDARRGHWTSKEGAEQLHLIFDKCGQNMTRVESRVKGTPKEGGDAFIDEIRHRERVYSKYVNLYPVRPVKDKVTRAHSVQSIVQEGRVYLNRHDAGHQRLLEELTMFTGQGGFHDDYVDAFVWALGGGKMHERTGDVAVKSGLEGVW